MTPLQAAEPWMPNGFPPPSFVVETEPVRSRRGTRTPLGGRGRWLAAAAVLGVLLLIAGLLLSSREGDDGTALTSVTTTSGVTDSNPTFPSTALDPTASLPTATTGPAGVIDPNAPELPSPSFPSGADTTAAPPTPSLPGSPPGALPGASPGVLTPASGTVNLPRAFTNRQPVSAPLGLRNTGPSPLSFSSRSGSGITVDPSTGSIAPGASLNVAIRFDGNGIAEGPYNGSVVFEGSGGTRAVQVRTTVAKPPAVTTSNGTTFAQPPAPGACNGPWAVRAAVSDPSGVRSVSATISRTGQSPIGQALTPDPDRPGAWSLTDLEQATGIVRFTIRAVDNLDAETVTPEEIIDC